MVGFASAGSGFATRVLPGNLWIFHSLTILLAISRLMLTLEYLIASVYLPPNTAFNLRCVTLFMFLDSLIYIAFAAETFVVMVKADELPGIGFEDTHLNVRMGLLTLIIIGDGIISVTRIVNRTVGNGWTRWSFVHIFGVTISVYLLWQSYFDITPTEKLGKLRQKMWTCLHFPLHALLILLSEGMQILALTLDVSLKLKRLRDTILSACDITRPTTSDAIDSINRTIASFGIDFTHGAMEEKYAIQGLLWDLRRQSRLCPSEVESGALNIERSHDIMGNVTVALFSSMGITPPDGHTTAKRSEHLLTMYLRMFGFVFLYYFIVAALAMFIFAAFIFLVNHDPTKRVFRLGATGTRVVAGFSLLSIIALVSNFDLAYKYMTNPIILFTVALALLICLLSDQLWHTLAFYYASFETESGNDIELDAIPTNT
ncbi:conserved hypothetical protein [Trichophyton verrucosum HKI 0517]|uniref:Uncharacterized protein n=1 Tax=Trichophyton verrucosum (strain HKI 0517) TaxID=663202 RepID=D4DAM2_TRIVH|nr:uncharacterized protein TRV_04170 [Trichophyton verrucosum HKI 0517]EFE41094.1 conserved hypothetical protein [Trichophyton verrucosum HKI 0517]